jgi:hypothetical protein
MYPSQVCHKKNRFKRWFEAECKHLSVSGGSSKLTMDTVVFRQDLLDVGSSKGGIGYGGFSQDLVVRNFRIWILFFLDIGCVLSDTRIRRRPQESELFRRRVALARRTSGFGGYGINI